MPFFSKRVSMLEVQNRALIKTAGERAERIDKLEHELRHERERQQAARESAEDIGRLERELQQARESAENIGRLERELQQARERVQHIDSLECELEQVSRELERLKTEREFYFKRVEDLEEHNRALTDSATKYSMLSQKLERELAEASIKYQKLERELTEAATKYSLWGQKLERELARIDPNGAPRRRFGAQCED
jgi:chromosome segregation ATPase